MNVIVLLNGAAGKSAARQSEEDTLTIERAFASAGGAAEIRRVEGPQLTQAARNLASSSPADTIITAAGGDGTQSAVAAALAGTPRRMGVLPMGTLNHFARDLGVPTDIAQAARTIVSGSPRAIDVAEINGRVFINNSSIGLYPHVVHHRDQLRQRLGHGKWAAMLHAFLAIFARFPVVRIRMNVNGNSWVTTTPFVFVGNNRYTIEGFNLGQRQSLQQGQLSIYFANHTGRSGLLRLALRALVGQLRQDRDFQALSASEVWIDAQSHQLSVALDGEVHRFAPPLHYRVIPRTLQVMLPASLD